MARGYPDYQNPVNQVAGRLVDFAGIQTAQLGLSTLDGLGRLVWVDRFGEGLSAWETYTLGAGLVPVIDDAISEIPPSSGRLRIAGLALGATSGIRRSFQFTDPNKVGVEFSVLFNAGNCVVDLNITRVLDAVNSYLIVRYSPLARTVQIIRGLDTWILVTYAAFTMARMWIPIKLVLDFENGVGRKLVIGCETFGLGAITLGGGAWADTDQLYIDISAVSYGVLATDQYIGHVYLTADEP
jgi:hypothetical protein